MALFGPGILGHGDTDWFFSGLLFQEEINKMGRIKPVMNSWHKGTCSQGRLCGMCLGTLRHLSLLLGWGHRVPLGSLPQMDVLGLPCGHSVSLNSLVGTRGTWHVGKGCGMKVRPGNGSPLQAQPGAPAEGEGD